jgi:hypothetical protein
MRALAIGAALVTLASVPACADWRYAKWGATAAEVIAASGGEARAYRASDDIVCAYDRLKIMAVVPRKIIDGTTYNVSFCHAGDGRLSSVLLNADTSANPYQLRQAMLAQYGRPISSSGSETMWHDKARGNAVTFDGMINGRIEYRPLRGGL